MLQSRSSDILNVSVYNASVRLIMELECFYKQLHADSMYEMRVVSDRQKQKKKKHQDGCCAC